LMNSDLTLAFMIPFAISAATSSLLRSNRVEMPLAITLTIIS